MLYTESIIGISAEAEAFQERVWAKKKLDFQFCFRVVRDMWVGANDGDHVKSESHFHKYLES